MNRFIPWRAICTYSCVALCGCTFAFAGSYLLESEGYERVVSIWAIGILVVFICTCFIILAWTTPPDYITKQRVQVWSDIRERSFVLPTLPDLENFLYLFCEKTLEVVKTMPDLSAKERLITRDQLKKMLVNASILFTRDPMLLKGPEWRVRDRGCAQRGKLLAVKFFSPFTPMNLFQGLWHMIDAEVLKRPPDPKHENTFWWRAMDKVQERVEADLYRADWLADSAQILKS